MADQQTHDAVRAVLRSAGVGTAALVLAAAAAAPALASGHGEDNGHGGSGHANNGNHYGQYKHDGDDTSATSDSGHNPPGNNGTVFIHDVAGDHHPHNVPHVGCTFYVDFFGFDNGQDVTVSFAGQAPTGKGTPLGGTQTLSPVSSDDAGGAGNDWDNEIAVTDSQLGVSALGAPKHQGYHIKMTVATNEPGGHKYKVFWLQPCTQTAATTTPPDTGTTDTPQTGNTGGETTGGLTTGGESTGSTDVGGHESSSAGQSDSGATSESAATGTSAGAPTEVLGRSIKRSGASPATAPEASSLPFTGAEIGGMAAAAAVALASGAALTIAGRRRRNAGRVSES